MDTAVLPQLSQQRGPATASHPGLGSRQSRVDPVPTQAMEHRSLTTIREKLIKIGAKVVAHGRYVTFQMAGVAVSRDLFQGILKLINGLRAPQAPV